MVDVHPSYHGEIKGGEPPQDPSGLFIDSQSTSPPKRRQNSKSLNTYKLFKDLEHPTMIEFDIKEDIFYATSQHSKYFVQHIRNIIQQ